jgi:ketosteroid isomerase-like protein
MNTEVIERGYEALNQGDLEAASALVAPQYVARFAETAAAWEEVVHVPQAFVEVDAERTIAVVRFKARKSSGAEVDQILATVWTIRDGRATSIETHESLNEALAAVRPDYG